MGAADAGEHGGDMRDRPCRAARRAGDSASKCRRAGAPARRRTTAAGPARPRCRRRDRGRRSAGPGAGDRGPGGAARRRTAASRRHRRAGCFRSGRCGRSRGPFRRARRDGGRARAERRAAVFVRVSASAISSSLGARCGLARAWGSKIRRLGGLRAGPKRALHARNSRGFDSCPISAHYRTFIEKTSPADRARKQVTKRRRRLRFLPCNLLDSMSTLDPVSTAKPRPRARRAEAPRTANEEPKFKPLPRWARPQSADPGAAIFAAGAGLALFDQILRGASGRRRAGLRRLPAPAARAQAAESCATLARLREDAAALARRRASSRRRRDEPGRPAASPVPALRLAAGPPRRGGLARGGAARAAGDDRRQRARRRRRRGARPAHGRGAGQRRRDETLPHTPPTPKSSPSWSPISLWRAV